MEMAKIWVGIFVCILGLLGGMLSNKVSAVDASIWVVGGLIIVFC